MPKKLPPDTCLSLRVTADMLGFDNTYGTKKVKHLIFIGEIKGHQVGFNNWCVSSRSVEKWRQSHE